MIKMLKEINSYDELTVEIGNFADAFLLLYKPESENCNCAIDNLLKISGLDSSNIIIMKADVSKVRNIHTEFGIDTVPSMLQFKNGEFINVVKGCMTSDFYESMIKRNFVVGGRKDSKTQKRVIVYSTNSCVWCTRLKDHLKQNNIKFEDVDVGSNSARAEEMKRKSGQMGVPQTEIGGQMIVGFDKLKINALLGIN